MYNTYFLIQDNRTVEKPIMIFEIKVSVNASLARVGLGDLTQTLLEGHYCGQQYGLKKVAVCFTDVAMRHFLECDCQPKDHGMISVLSTTTVFAENEYKDLIHVMAGIMLKLISDEFTV